MLYNSFPNVSFLSNLLLVLFGVWVVLLLAASFVAEDEPQPKSFALALLVRSIYSLTILSTLAFIGAVAMLCW